MYTCGGDGTIGTSKVSRSSRGYKGLHGRRLCRSGLRSGRGYTRRSCRPISAPVSLTFSGVSGCHSVVSIIIVGGRGYIIVRFSTKESGYTPRLLIYRGWRYRVRLVHL